MDCLFHALAMIGFFSFWSVQHPSYQNQALIIHLALLFNLFNFYYHLKTFCENVFVLMYTLPFSITSIERKFGEGRKSSLYFVLLHRQLHAIAQGHGKRVNERVLY